MRKVRAAWRLWPQLSCGRLQKIEKIEQNVCRLQVRGLWIRPDDRVVVISMVGCRVACTANLWTAGATFKAPPI